MTRRGYARGRRAIGICQRSGKKLLRRDMVEDGHIPGLLVAPDWWEPRHPQEFPLDAGDTTGIFRPSPEDDSFGGGGSGVILPLSASWSPAPVDEDIIRSQFSATEYTLNASDGAGPFSYFAFAEPGSVVTVQQTGLNTFRLFMPPSATLGQVYQVQVTGVIQDAIGQQSVALFSVEMTAVASEFEEVLAPMEPDHWWKFQDDSLTNFVDSGFSTTMNLTCNSGVICKRLPAALVGLAGAKGYGIGYSEPNTPSQTPVASTAIAQNSTGTFIGWVRATTTAAASDSLPVLFSTRYLANEGIRFQIAIVNVSGIRLEVDVNNNNSNRLLVRSDPGSIIRGKWHFIVVTQPGDGTGPKIYIDGVSVNVTISLSGSGNNNWWLSTLNSLVGSPSNFRVTGTWQSSSTRGQFQHMACWDSGDVLSDADVQALYLAGSNNLIANATPRANSFHDVARMFDFQLWLAINTPPLTGNTPVAQFGKDGDYYRFTDMEAGDFDLGAGVLVNTDVDLSDDSVLFFDTPTNNDGINEVSNADAFTGSTGTLIFFVYPTTVTGDRTFFANGIGSTSYIRLEIIGARFRFNWTTASGTNFYRITVNAVTVVTGTWYMIAVTHDGTAPRIFIDGVEYTGGDLTIASAGTGSASGCWFSAMSGSAQLKLSGINGSGSVNPFFGRMKHLIYDQQVLTPANILALYNAARVVA